MKSLDRIGLTLALLVVLLPAAACSKDPDVAKREHVASGDRYVAENKLAEAAIEYKNATVLDAKFGEARFKLGETYEKLAEARFKLGEIPEAEANLRNAYNEFVRAEELLPDRDDVQLKAGRYRMRASQFKEAKDIAERLLKKNPKNVDAQILRAGSLASLKDIPSAIRELESALQKDPTRLDSYLYLAEAQYQSKNLAEAESVLRDAISAKPDSVDVRVALAKIYLAGRDVAKAEATLKEALALQPGHEGANDLLVWVYLGSGRAKEAEGPLRSLAGSSTAVGPKIVLARYYFLMNRSQEALPILNELEKGKAGRGQASMLLAQWEHANGQKDAAQKRLDVLLTQEPGNVPALLLKARLLGSDGKVDEALARAQAAAAAAPRSAEAPYVVGMLYLQKNDTERALKAFTDALTLNPSSPDASLQVAKIQLNQAASKDQLRAVVTTVEDVLGKKPGNPQARATLIRALLAQAQLSRADKDAVSAQAQISRAEREAARLVSDAPTLAEAHNMAGAVALVKRNLPASRAAYAKALELDRTSTVALAGLMGADMASGKPADAVARLSARLAADPNNPALLTIAAQAYRAMGDAAKTEEALRKLIEVEPSNLQAYSDLVGLLYLQKRLDAARVELEQYTQRNPKNVGFLTAIGMILHAQNRTAEAQGKYEQIIQIDPNAAVAANNLAWIYAEQNAKLEVAVQLAETAKSKMPDRAEVDDTLGWVYYRKGLTTLAIASFKQSTAKDPTNPAYHYRLVLACVKEGDKLKARESLQRALALGADPEVVKLRGPFNEAAEARKILATLG